MSFHVFLSHSSADKPAVEELARPADYGPAPFTNCVADISPGLKDFLGLQGADEIVVEVPVPR
jgi:hypothetical protein